MKKYLLSILLLSSHAFAEPANCSKIIQGIDLELDRLLAQSGKLDYVCGYFEVADGTGCPLMSHIASNVVFSVRLISPIANLSVDADKENEISERLAGVDPQWEGQSISLPDTKSYLKSVINKKCSYRIPLASESKYGSTVEVRSKSTEKR